MEEKICTFENSSLYWKRPSGPMKIWRIIECPVQTKNSDNVKLYIQDIPKNRYDDVLDHLSKYYIRDEAVCASLNAKNDPLFIEDLRAEWRDNLEQGVSVGAFLEDGNIKKSLLIAANVLYVGTMHDDEVGCGKLKFKSQMAERMLSKLWEVIAKADICGRMMTETYIGGCGLCVHPLYRGTGIAKLFLDVRTDIGRELNVRVTASEFTGIASQSLANERGFQLLFEIRYNDILDENGKVLFPVTSTKTLKVMSKLLY